VKNLKYIVFYIIKKALKDNKFFEAAKLGNIKDISCAFKNFLIEKCKNSKKLIY